MSFQWLIWSLWATSCAVFYINSCQWYLAAYKRRVRGVFLWKRVNPAEVIKNYLQVNELDTQFTQFTQFCPYCYFHGQEEEKEEKEREMSKQREEKGVNGVNHVNDVSILTENDSKVLKSSVSSVILKDSVSGKESVEGEPISYTSLIL